MVKLEEGSFACGYFNPRTGAGTDALLRARGLRGLADHTFTAPGAKDWLLVIRSKSNGRILQAE